MKTHNKQRNNAFTLIELLTVIAIIAALVGIMAVAIKSSTRHAKNLRQKAELRAMEIGLELFSKDFTEYPDSAVLSGGGSAICGAQHLAEALVGRDERGFEPQTGWYAPNDAQYKSNAPANLYDPADQKSLVRRKPPYVEFKESGIYTIADLWLPNPGVGSSTIYTSSGYAAAKNRAPVITDTFRRHEITISGQTVKVGLPILYFKCSPDKRFRVDQTRKTVTSYVSPEYSQWSYNFNDNYPIVALPQLNDPTQTNQGFRDTVKNQAQVFYEKITQKEEPARDYYKPFNANTFILMSAGWDGIYGTKDDITNFNY